MTRRLYFLFPDADHVRRVVDALDGAGIGQRHLHAVARPGIDLSELPVASARQRQDMGLRLERILWSANLIVFFIALTVLLVSMSQGLWPGAVAAAVVMLVTFIAGERFATKMPNMHLDAFDEALAHGEVLLMVDVPKRRVFEIEELVHRHYPDANVGGVGWTVEAMDL